MLSVKKGANMTQNFNNEYRDNLSHLQFKTKKLLELPLTDNVKYALLDYLKNARPKIETNSPFENVIFTSSNIFSFSLLYFFTIFFNSKLI